MSLKRELPTSTLSGFALSNSRCDIKAESNFMLQTASKILFPIIMLFGVYVMIYGHLSPGGGFQGGVIIASGVLLLLISYKTFEVPHAVIVALETFAFLTS